VVQWHRQYHEDCKPVSAVQTGLTGIVLSIEPAGGRFLRARIFDEDNGLCSAHFPGSIAKMPKLVPPDLFDDLECRLNPNRSPSSIPFVAEYQKVRSFRELARNPTHFLSASKIARFYLQNGSHLLEPSPRLKLLRTALSSFARAGDPQAVLLKLYFCFARDEGLPVRESWLNTLPGILAAEANKILFEPINRSVSREHFLDELIGSIKLWMNSETELMLE
jgi:hypothetical protein